MKILHYIHIKPMPYDGYTLAYRVYNYDHNADCIECGYFHSMAEMITFVENNGISEYFDMTYKIGFQCKGAGAVCSFYPVAMRGLYYSVQQQA